LTISQGVAIVSQLSPAFPNHMNLRDQLKKILPDILPSNPADSIKGTELIDLVKYRLNSDYSDATLRYHFSIMSCDPSAPIAKVEQGQGYYLRSTTIHSLESARNLITSSQGLLLDTADPNADPADVDVMITRANKFRSVFQRFTEMSNGFPFLFERSFSGDHGGTNRWRFPDAVVVDWQVGRIDEDNGFSLDHDQIEVRRRLSSPPFSVGGVKLKLGISHNTLREDMFQCLSTSLWTNTGELVVAAPIADEQLLEEIRQLAGQFGIGVTSFGLTAEDLDDLPEPATIDNLLPREFEAIQSQFQRRRIVSAIESRDFDWQHVADLRDDHRDFDRFERWISRSLIDERAYSVREFLELEKNADSGRAHRSNISKDESSGSEIVA
jgi:hypothetical protein